MKPKTPPNKKMTAKKTAVTETDSDDEMEIVRAPPKRAARMTAKKYVEIISDNEEDGDGAESMFVDDD
jgi:DNA topoisomerase II